MTVICKRSPARVAALVLVSAAALVGAAAAADGDLKIETLSQAETCERQAARGDMMTMHYRGTLESDGSEFDSSYSRSDPFQFQLGVGQVIKGWDQGLLGMCVGEKRKLTIPASLGYGEAGAGDKIPPGATLVFEVTRAALASLSLF